LETFSSKIAHEKDEPILISYTRADLRWAEWTAWQLEDKGYTTILQAWDFRSGANFYE